MTHCLANPLVHGAYGNSFPAPRLLPKAGLLVPELIQYKIICQIHVVEGSLDDCFAALVDAKQGRETFRDVFASGRSARL